MALLNKAELTTRPLFTHTHRERDYRIIKQIEIIKNHEDEASSNNLVMNHV